MDFYSRFEYKLRVRSNSEPVTPVQYRNITHIRSQSVQPHNDRISFNGCITAGAVFICKQDGLDYVCSTYNECDKSHLAEDHPATLCGLPYGLVKTFPQQVENHPVLKSLVTEEMKAKAKKHSRRVSYGHDFIFRHCIKTSLLEQKRQLCSNLVEDKYSNMHLMCQIVVPSEKWASKYPNIDIAGLSGKTSYKRGDKDILQTLIAETREEIGLVIGERLPNGKPGILHPGYQLQMRKKHNMFSLPYDFRIGSHENATQVFVLVVDEEDLINCQIVPEIIDKSYDHDIEVINQKLQTVSLKHKKIYDSTQDNGWISGDIGYYPSENLKDHDRF